MKNNNNNSKSRRIEGREKAHIQTHTDGKNKEDRPHYIISLSSLYSISFRLPRIIINFFLAYNLFSLFSFILARMNFGLTIFY